MNTWHAYEYVTCLMNTWHASWIRDMPHEYVTCLMNTWHASFMYDMPHLYDTTHSHATRPIHLWHDPFICDMTTSYVTERIHTWNASYILDRVRSMRMGFVIPRSYSGDDLGTYRGLAKAYWGRVYRSGCWLNYFGLFSTYSFGLFPPGVDNWS